MKYLILTLVLVGCAGPKGQPGSAGPSGAPGPAGASCHIEEVSNGALITCGDTQTVVLNGQDGEDATPTAYAISEVIRPCPGTGFREVLLRTYSGEILAHYSDGTKQFLTFLTPGSYVLTDGSSCHFTINSSMEVSW